MAVLSSYWLDDSLQMPPAAKCITCGDINGLIYRDGEFRCADVEMCAANRDYNIHWRRRTHL
jgi:hypothetical protein